MAVSFSDDLGITDDPIRFAEAIRALRDRVPLSDSEWRELAASERARSFGVAAVVQAEVVQELRDAIESAIADELTFKDFEERALTILEVSGERTAATLENVFRTNVLGAYNAGRHEIFSDPVNRELRPYWRFEAILDERTDEDCEECDGVVLPSDDPWWQEHLPPLHYQCRCTFTALDPDEAAEEGIDEEGPDVEVGDGFGVAPGADDYEPDSDRFDDDVAEILDGKASSG
jgi:SPP1 gp7 family putative phage head morphogenesis protein